MLTLRDMVRIVTTSYKELLVSDPERYENGKALYDFATKCALAKIHALCLCS
jgi:hypothetical protein